LKNLSEHTIILSPIGKVKASLLPSIGDIITSTFGFSTQVVSLLPDVSFAYDSNRSQYNSTEILNQLSPLLPKNAIRIIAITDVDLFIPILTYVYGEAQMGGSSAILSIHRLKESLPSISPDEVMHERLSKEAIHEIGHTFNLKHCQDSTCIMHYCRGINDVDQKTNQLCRYCQILLSDEIKKIP
jgi:archaemetzincin